MKKKANRPTLKSGTVKDSWWGERLSDHSHAKTNALRTVAFGHWTLDCGPWTVDFAPFSNPNPTKIQPNPT